LWERLGLSVVPELDFSAQNVKNEVAGPEKKSVVPGDEKVAMPVEATPIQILLGMNYLLNGSHQVLPHVLDRVLERNGEHEYLYRVPIVGEVNSLNPSGSAQAQHPASAEIWKLFKAKGHKGVLDSVFFDTQALSFQPFDAADHGLPGVAGPKDGESTIRGGEYLRSRMMFVLLPAEKPELILMVIVREPYLEPTLVSAKNVWDLAGPVGKILPSMVALQQVHKNLSDMMSMSERKGGNYQQEQEKKALAGLETILESHHTLMPDLVGMSLRRALRLLQDKKIKIRIQGTGRVVAQSPLAGKPLDGVKECLLTLKKDEKIDITVPAKSKIVSDGKLKNKVDGKK